MGKYIWPGDVAKASRWYMMLLKEVVRGVTLTEFIDLLGRDAPPRKLLYSRLEVLAKRGLVSRLGKNDELRYKISRLGIQTLAQLELFQLTVPHKWDATWRIILFDIPESSRAARHHIRRLLKELGFQQLQLSAWIHPLPCFEQFKQLQQSYGITEHIHLIEVPSFTPPADIVATFQKMYPVIASTKTVNRDDRHD